MSLSISANNPFRPADWRWKRAVAIYEGDPSALPASRRRDGTDGFKWITTAIRFQREYAAAANDVAVVANDETINADNSRALLAERRPEIFWAHWCRRCRAGRRVGRALPPVVRECVAPGRARQSAGAGRCRRKRAGRSG